MPRIDCDENGNSVADGGEKRPGRILCLLLRPRALIGFALAAIVLGVGFFAFPEPYLAVYDFAVILPRIREEERIEREQQEAEQRRLAEEERRRQAEIARVAAEEERQRQAQARNQQMMAQGFRPLDAFLASGTGIGVRSARLSPSGITIAWGNNSQETQPDLDLTFHDDHGTQIGALSRSWIMDTVAAGATYVEEDMTLDSGTTAGARWVRWQDRSTTRPAQQAQRESSEQAALLEGRRAFESVVAMAEQATNDDMLIVRTQLDGSSTCLYVTVDQSFHLMPYQFRLQHIQTYHQLWEGCLAHPRAGFQPLSHGQLSVIDLYGNEVGGSRVFGGAWAQDQ